jgi:hypothetical protein
MYSYIINIINSYIIKTAQEDIINSYDNIINNPPISLFSKIEDEFAPHNIKYLITLKDPEAVINSYKNHCADSVVYYLFQEVSGINLSFVDRYSYTVKIILDTIKSITDHLDVKSAIASYDNAKANNTLSMKEILALYKAFRNAQKELEILTTNSYIIKTDQEDIDIINPYENAINSYIININEKDQEDIIHPYYNIINNPPISLFSEEKDKFAPHNIKYLITLNKKNQEEVINSYKNHCGDSVVYYLFQEVISGIELRFVNRCRLLYTVKIILDKVKRITDHLDVKNAIVRYDYAKANNTLSMKEILALYEAFRNAQEELEILTTEEFLMFDKQVVSLYIKIIFADDVKKFCNNPERELRLVVSCFYENGRIEGVTKENQTLSIKTALEDRIKERMQNGETRETAIEYLFENMPMTDDQKQIFEDYKSKNLKEKQIFTQNQDRSRTFVNQEKDKVCDVKNKIQDLFR